MRRKTKIALAITFMVVVMVSAFSYLYISQLLRQRGFILPTRNRNRTTSHPGGKLHTQMSQPADAQNGDQITSPHTAVA